MSVVIDGTSGVTAPAFSGDGSGLTGVADEQLDVLFGWKG